MLSPGAKGWIKKYFELLETGEIRLPELDKLAISSEHYLHLQFGKSGIVFGYPSELLFSKHLEKKTWTTEEKLKLLLFEAHLLVFKFNHRHIEFSEESFVASLLDFYAKQSTRSIMRMLTFYLKESPEEKLERIFARRTDIKLNLLENKWWVNSLTNMFVYLDVILFHDFLNHGNKLALNQYNDYALNALTAITLSAYSDGHIEGKEKAMFDVFVASAHLPAFERARAKRRFKKGATLEDFSPTVYKNWLFRRFIVDISCLTILGNHQAVNEELDFLQKLSDRLVVPQEELEEALVMIENFVVKNHQNSLLLMDSSSYEKVYKNFSNRWTKVILRNKDKLAVELKQSKELISLIKKSATTELSKEEKDVVKTQFMDIVKSMPALAIFMLPGGTILMPILLKILPELVPSAFRENELDKDE